MPSTWRRFGWAAVVAAATVAAAWGDEIVTTNGQRVTGSIIEESSDVVRLRTAKGAVMTLPRAQIKSMRREDLSMAEAEGDLAVARKDYYRAQKMYEEAGKDKRGSSSLDGKLASVRAQIAEQESALYDGLLQEGLKASRDRNHDVAVAKLREIVNRAPADGPYAAKARRALACEYIAESLRLRDRVEYANAIQAMRAATEADPTMSVAFLELAVLLQNYSKDTESAIDTYRKGVDVAKAELEKGGDSRPRTSEEAVLPKEVTLDRSRFNAHRYELAMLLYTSGRKREAAQDFLDLIEEKNLSQAKAEQAVTHIVEAFTDPKINRDLDHDKILEQLDRALELKPRTAKAWMLKGRIFLEDGNASEALAAFNHAIEIDATIPTLHSSRAEAYLNLKEADLARRDLETEIHTRPKFALWQDTYMIRCELGRVMTIGADYDGAIEQYSSAVEIEGDQVPAHLGRAKARRLKAMAADASPSQQATLFDDADKDIETVFPSNPDDLDLTLEKASLIVARGRVEEIHKQNEAARRHYDEALKFLGVVIKAVQNRQERQGKLTRGEALLLAEALCSRGDVDLSQNNKNRARDAFEAALQARPGFALAYNRLSEVSKRQGSTDEARALGLKAIEYDPNAPNYELDLAVLLHRHLKAYAEAIEHYEAYQKKGGQEPRVPDWIRECRNAIEAGGAVVPVMTPPPALAATTETTATQSATPEATPEAAPTRGASKSATKDKAP